MLSVPFLWLKCILNRAVKKRKNHDQKPISLDDHFRKLFSCKWSCDYHASAIQIYHSLLIRHYTPFQYRLTNTTPTCGAVRCLCGVWASTQSISADSCSRFKSNIHKCCKQEAKRFRDFTESTRTYNYLDVFENVSRTKLIMQASKQF